MNAIAYSRVACPEQLMENPMRDGEVTADQSLIATHKAITYLLDRVQRDENLRHYLLHTEAHHLLIVAEAKRLSVDPEEHEAKRQEWLGEGKCLPKVVRYERLLDEHEIEY
jgi:hypothetical protein